MRDIRRTAWILLSSFASVADIEGNVLTMAFDSEGNAKGFASSGSDGYLADVLQSMFGVRPVIRAIVQPGAGRGGGRPVQGGRDDGPDSVAAPGGGSGHERGRDRAAPGDDDQAGPATAGGTSEDEPAAAAAARGETYSDSQARTGAVNPAAAADRTSRGAIAGSARSTSAAASTSRGAVARSGQSTSAAASTGQGAGAPSGRPASAADRTGHAAGPDSGRSGTATGRSGPEPDPESAPGSAASRRTQSTGAAAARAALADAAGRGGSGSCQRGASPLGDDPRLQTDSEPPGPGVELTGTDLIVRELGGQVIEEISGS